MKAASADVFLLIRSLTKSEKKYFRQYAARHTIGSQNQYLDLFDAIEAQTTYDEPALKQQLAHTPFISYLPVAKQYLYQQLLEGLDAYHHAQSIEAQIKQQLNFARILWRKKLLTQAEKVLDKAHRQIEKYGLYEYYIEWSLLERRLLRGNKTLTTQKVQEAYQSLDQRLLDLQQTNRYWLWSNSIMSLHYEKVAAASPDHLAHLEQLVHLLRSHGEPPQLIARLDYYRALATYSFMTGNIQQASQYNIYLLDLFEQHPHLIELEREQYLAAFNNYLIDQHLIGNHEATEAGIQRLRQLPQQPIFRAVPHLEIKILELTYSLQLNTRIRRLQFAEALALLPDLQRALKKYAKDMAYHYLLSFYYLMAYIYFANQQYAAALSWLDLLRTSEHRDKMEELLLAADRLYLLTHFELGNYLLLDHLMQSVRRAHRKQKTGTSLDAALFKYLKKLSLATSAAQSLPLYQRLAATLQDLKPSATRAWNYFNFDWWIAAKLPNTTDV